MIAFVALQMLIIISLIMSVAKRRKAEKELREREEFNWALFNYNPVETTVVDLRGRVVKSNLAKRKFGGRLPNIGDVMYKNYAGKHKIDMYAELMKCIKSDKPKRFPAQKYDNKILSIVIAPFSGGAIITSEDITEQKLLQEKLIQSEKLAAIGKLISGIVHEINNPLTGIIGFSELLAKEVKGLNKTQKKELAMISSEAKRIAKIVSGLLAFARKHKSQKEPVIINNVLNQVLKIREHELKVSNINVKKELKKRLPNVEVNIQQIQQVFLNIINNAEHAMLEAHKKGNLTIRTYKKSNMMYIEFINDGKNIPEKDLMQIFHPFFTTKETGKGTGLGLSISYGIIKEHNGNIFAESQEGKETKITVELPIIGKDLK